MPARPGLPGPLTGRASHRGLGRRCLRSGIRVRRAAVRPAHRPLAAAALLGDAPRGAARRARSEVPNVGGKPLRHRRHEHVHRRLPLQQPQRLPTSDVRSRRQVDDDYGEWLDRLNVQASWWRLRLGLRLDAALYFHAPNADTVAATVEDQKRLIDAAAAADAKLAGRLRERLRERLLPRAALALPPRHLPVQALRRLLAARPRRDRGRLLRAARPRPRLQRRARSTSSRSTPPCAAPRSSPTTTSAPCSSAPPSSPAR